MNLVTTNLELFETTKEQRLQFVDALVGNLIVGNANPLKVHLQVKCLEDLIKQITSNPNYRELLLEESMKFGKSFEFQNAKFEIKEAGVKYDYSKTNDPIILKLLQEQEELEAKIKERQTFLKAIKNSLEVLIEDEVVTLYPPSKSSTTSITVNFK